MKRASTNSALAASLVDVAQLAATRAGALLMRRFGGAMGPLQTKSSPSDIVSEVDREAEATLTRCLFESRPDDGLLAEEGSERPSRTGLRWIVDPLDGTTNYVEGVPHFCVSIACEDSDEGLLVGVIYDPVRDELFSAYRGGGAFLGGVPIKVSGEAQLSRALVATGFSYDAALRRRQGTLMAEVVGRARDIRRGGSAALDLAWVACGRYDAYYESPLAYWDVAAGILLVQEAAGEVSEWSLTGSGRGVVAAGRPLRQDLAGLLEEFLARPESASHPLH